MQSFCIGKNFLKMPANLNALIRYKVIDRCLSNPYICCSINKLREICTEALTESRGWNKKNDLISERTIRDDIRVMRSDIFGFNAPIVFEDGCYRYSDPEYTIFSITIHQKSLLEDILSVLSELTDDDRYNSSRLHFLIRDINYLIDGKSEEELQIPAAKAEPEESPGILKDKESRVKSHKILKMEKAQEEIPDVLKTEEEPELFEEKEYRSFITNDRPLKKKKVIKNSSDLESRIRKPVIKWKDVFRAFGG